MFIMEHCQENSIKSDRSVTGLVSDIVIVGGGIVGLSIASELNNRFPDSKIILIEKEGELASHASGRNSGVLHAGFYYTPDSKKAKLTVEGNRLLTEYCLTNNLAINRCGKVVVTKDEEELNTLYELKRRGSLNGVPLEIIDENQLDDFEPNAKTFCKALYSPTTSTVNPSELVRHLGKSLIAKKNMHILLNEAFVTKEAPTIIRTKRHKINYKYLINTAGLYADKIAHKFGVGERYTLIPFKGLYLEYKNDNLINKHVYPVPNISNPFLGTHFTKMVDGKVKMGPTAVPAFWRENYHGFSKFNLVELFEIVNAETKLFYLNAFNFRKITFEEFKKYYRKYFVQQGSQLLKKINASMFGDYLKPGIRAQLLDKDTKELVMDFIVEHGENSTHVLNAVSPAFTCAFSFSKFIANSIESRLN